MYSDVHLSKKKLHMLHTDVDDNANDNDDEEYNWMPYDSFDCTLLIKRWSSLQIFETPHA